MSEPSADEQRTIPDTLEGLLLDNVLQSRGEPMKKQQIFNELKLNWGWHQVVAVTALLAIGLTLFYKFEQGFGHAVGEAVLIAGLLAIAVDPFLKRRLQKEAAEDIFHHLLGFGLPEEIRNDLQQFVQSNHCYRENLVIRCEAHIVNDKVRLDVEISGKIVAAKDTSYTPYIAFEESFNPIVNKFSISPVSRARDLNIPIVKLEESENEQMVREWKAPGISLDKGEKLDTVIKYSVEGGLSDFYIIFFEHPAIFPIVELIPNSMLEMKASHTQRNPDGSYFYDKVFRQADHIQIRWRPKKSEALQPSTHGESVPLP